MKVIRIKALRLLNFCGVREASYEFSDELTTISGKNGIGKSTVANAITYVLFGTDTKGNSLDIKTYDADRNIIPEISHEAELLIVVDGEGINLKRTLTDSWKGESVKNTYKYFVNGENVTANDFKKKVNDIYDTLYFRMTLLPNYIPSMASAEQYDIVRSLVPATEQEEITGGDKKFDYVVEALKKENMEKLIHHLKYQRKEVQGVLDKVPTRLVELNKALPEKQDWDALKNEKQRIADEYDALQQDAIKIKNGGADMVRKDGLRNRLDFAQKRKDNMESSARNEADELATKHSSDLINANTAYKKAESVVSEFKQLMGGFTETEIQIKEQIEKCKQEVIALNTKQACIDKLEWKWNDEDSFCPHCGQPLPMDKLEEVKAKSLENFNQSKARGLKELQDKFATVKAVYKEAKRLLEEQNENRITTTNRLKEAQKVLSEAEQNLAKVKADEPKTYSMILDEKAEYQNVVNEIAELRAELDKPSDNDEESKKLLEDIESKKAELKAKMEQVTNSLKQEESFLRVCKLIEDAKADKKKFQAQLDELDDKLSIANEYNQNSCRIVEEKVNKLFRYVKWTLFKTNLDGVKVPYCECYHDGVPYSSLNSAAKVNAGIDIAYTISQHYDVSVPMILDECESTLHPIMRPNSQQIRFYVTHDEKLKVETPALAVME